MEEALLDRFSVAFLLIGTGEKRPGSAGGAVPRGLSAGFSVVRLLIGIGENNPDSSGGAAS